MKLVLFLALVGYTLGEKCDDFRPWSDQSECIWPRNAEGHMSFDPMRETFLDKCKITVPSMDGKKWPDITDKYKIEIPDKCGKCAFKIRCRNRDKKDGCFSLNFEKENCEEHSEVCDMPKMPKFKSCRYGLMSAMLLQCTTNRPDIPMWKREGYAQAGQIMPEFNCEEEGDRCKCCCHPSRPVKEDGKYVCKEVPHVDKSKQCEAFGPYNEWSDCLWFPLKEMANGVKNHCGLSKMVPEGKGDGDAEDAVKKALKALDMPDKCGFCSFKVRCRKRKGGQACFPFEGDKMSCGNEQCDKCGDICKLPKVPQAVSSAHKDTCDWTKTIMEQVKKRVGKFMPAMKKLYWKKRGYMQMLKFLPVGKCVEKEGKCMCCCHPYVPNEEGTACVLYNMCKNPEDLGIEWNTNA